MADEVFELEDDFAAEVEHSKHVTRIRSEDRDLIDRDEELLRRLDRVESGVDNKKDGGDSGGEVARPSLTPPENFSMVCGQIYRSSFPKEENFPFLSQLNLKSVLCLISEEYPEENANFLQSKDINFYQIGLSGNKEPFVKIKANLIEDALKVVLNPANQPILIHCNRGKHRTGCLIGCIRKLQKWSLSMIFDEYRKFSHPKSRPLDQQFIEMFDDDDINDFLDKNEWLPVRW